MYCRCWPLTGRATVLLLLSVALSAATYWLLFVAIPRAAIMADCFLSDALCGLINNVQSCKQLRHCVAVHGYA